MEERSASTVDSVSSPETPRKFPLLIIEIW